MENIHNQTVHNHTGSKMGRPVIGDPKTTYINVRASKSTVKQMKKGAKKEGLSDGSYLAKLIEDASK